MTTFLSPTPCVNLDAAALAHLADFWVTRALRHTGEYSEPDAGSSAAYAAGLGGGDEVNLSPYTAFVDGFRTAIKVAAAVIADPLGDPKSAIGDAVNTARAAIREDAAYSRVVVLDKSEFERLRAACNQPAV